MWLKYYVFTSELFPNTYIIYRSDRRLDALSALKGVGVFIAVSSVFFSEKVNFRNVFSNNLPCIDIVCNKFLVTSIFPTFFLMRSMLIL